MNKAAKAKQRLQQRLVSLQHRQSTCDEEHRASYQRQIDQTLKQIRELPGHIAASRSAPLIVRANGQSKECNSSGDEISSDEDGYRKTFCHCGCEKYYVGETYCNVLLNPNAAYGVSVAGCRIHISQHCRIKNRQCTGCAARAAATAEAAAHPLEQSVPAPTFTSGPLSAIEQSVPAPVAASHHRDDSRREDDSWSSSVRSRSRSRDRREVRGVPAPAPHRGDDSRRGGDSRSSSARSRSRSRDRREGRSVPVPASHRRDDSRRGGDSWYSSTRSRSRSRDRK